MDQDGLQQAQGKMREAGQPEEAIAAFTAAYRRLQGDESVLISSDELEPAGDVPALEDLPEADPAVLDRIVAVKLNGGLATSMGLRRPKSLVAARDGRSFLDIIVAQIMALRSRYEARLPLLLMNSRATEDDTRQALERYPNLALDGLPISFRQSMIPKLAADTLRPVSWPQAPEQEWCPPGHGDVYGALRSSGILSTLLDRGFELAMISNSDNLGATLDPRLASYVAAERIPFLMEVVQGTEADRKGGHIARRRRDGQLVLRETAQTPPQDAESFRDFRRWRYYNTNSLWIDLRALDAALSDSAGSLELPVIVNRKTVDPRDAASPKVVQLESAMGAAIGRFPGARIVRVPRTRFVPVKTTDDLLVLRSDVYTVSGDEQVEPVPERAGSLPYVELDPRFYKLIDDFERRFPDGSPSLRRASRLTVEGDVTFPAGVEVRGSVSVRAEQPTRLEPGILSGD